jgi:hypothetical protein
MSIFKRRGCREWIALATVASLAAILPPATAAAGDVPPALPKPIALAVSEALVAGFGAGATVDDSTVTRCMSAPAMPLAYRTDRIILRPSPTTTTTDVKNQVAAVLNIAMGVGAFTLGEPETITWDPAADPGAVVHARRFQAGPAIMPADADSLIRRVVSVPIQAEGQRTVPVVDVARRLRAKGWPASPDYLLAPGNGPLGVWPDGGPAPTGGPGAPRPGLGGGTTIAVYDTGVPDGTAAKLPPNLTKLMPGDTEQPDRNGDGTADLYFAVHLTAIAGVVATVAPDATVKGVRITGPNGIATDFSAAQRMASTLREAHDLHNWPQVIVNSFGSPVCGASTTGGGADMAPLGLEMVSEAVDRHQEAVVVAAAGNRGTDKRFYPAAFHVDYPAVLSVGALDATADADGDPWTSPSRTAKAATFSNFGPWVALWAPGVSLPTYHAIGLRFEINGSTIYGYAKVNGTSFAAPYMAAMIVEQVARTGQSPGQAWREIRQSGRTCSTALGGGVAVALTSMTATSTSTTSADPLLRTDC